MLFAVITALAFGVMLIVIASLIISARREQQRYGRAVAMQLAPQVAGTQPEKRNLSSAWYTSRRTLVSCALLMMFSIAFVMQGGLAGGTLQTLDQGLGLSLLNTTASSSNTLQAIAHSQMMSKGLIRIFYADPMQYSTNVQLQNWAPSACSEIALTEVMNSYGRHLRVSDVVQEELNLGVWDPNLGLLRDDGVALTAAHFGFKTADSHSQTLQQIIDIANKGYPVIVSIRDSVNFPNGHLFVVTGGDAQSVLVVDSSPLNLQHLSRGTFQAMWQGFSAVLTPQP